MDDGRAGEVQLADDGELLLGRGVVALDEGVCVAGDGRVGAVCGLHAVDADQDSSLLVVVSDDGPHVATLALRVVLAQLLHQLASRVGGIASVGGSQERGAVLAGALVGLDAVGDAVSSVEDGLQVVGHLLDLVPFVAGDGDGGWHDVLGTHHGGGVGTDRVVRDGVVPAEGWRVLWYLLPRHGRPEAVRLDVIDDGAYGDLLVAAPEAPPLPGALAVAVPRVGPAPSVPFGRVASAVPQDHAEVQPLLVGALRGGKHVHASAQCV